MANNCPLPELQIPTHHDGTVSEMTDAEGLNAIIIPDDNTITDFNLLANTIVNALPSTTAATTLPTQPPPNATTAATTLPTQQPPNATTTQPTSTTQPESTTQPVTTPGTTNALITTNEPYQPITDDPVPGEPLAVAHLLIANANTENNLNVTETTSETNKRPKDVKSVLYLATWNNYDDDTIKYVSTWEHNPKVKYARVAEEVGKNGTPHLQIVVQFTNPVVLGKPWQNRKTGKWTAKKGACAFFSINKVKANGTENSANVLVAKGDLYENWMYVSKGTQTDAERKGPNKNSPERGFGRGLKLLLSHPEGFTPKRGINGRQGMRSKIIAEDPKEPTKRPINFVEELNNRAKELILQVEAGDGLLNVPETLRAEYPEIDYDRPEHIPRVIRNIRKSLAKINCKIESEADLLPHQKFIANLLSEWPKKNDRNIRFVVDPRGGGGKSQLKKYLRIRAPNYFAFIRPGGKAHLATQLAEQLEEKPYLRLIILDCPRTKAVKAEGIPLDLLEELVDCELAVTKYKSIIHDLPESPHVAVFTNCEPDYNKLTVDRYTMHFILPGEDGVVTKGPRYALEKIIAEHGRDKIEAKIGVDCVATWLTRPIDEECLPPDVKAELRRKEVERRKEERRLKAEEENRLALTPIRGVPVPNQNTARHNQYVKEKTANWNLKKTDLYIAKAVSEIDKENDQNKNTDSIVVPPPRHFEDGEKKAAKKRRLIARTEINPEFLNTFTNPPPQSPGPANACNTVDNDTSKE